MKAFFDHNLSPHLAHASNVLIRPEGDQVIHLTDRFRPDTGDLAWMSARGDEGGWVVISADRRIHRNRLEREAWRRQSGLVVFFLTPQWRRLRHLEIARHRLRWWPRIDEQASNRPQLLNCRSPMALAGFECFADNLKNGQFLPCRSPRMRWRPTARGEAMR